MKLESKYQNVSRRFGWRAGSLGALLVVGAACASSSGAGDDEEARTRIERLGIEPVSVASNGDAVVVDDDMIFDRAALLRGDYEPDADQQVVDKGYRYKSLITANIGNIKLAFAANQMPSATMKTAISAAAAAWSAIPNSAIRISEANTGPTITVHSVSSLSWPPTVNGHQLDCNGTSGCASLPLNGKPGTDIYIESRPSNFGCVSSWSASMLAAILRHEFGHTLGFAHPNEANSVYVSPTGKCTLSETACLKPSYPTVMGSLVHTPACEAISVSKLSKDDYDTAALVY